MTANIIKMVVALGLFSFVSSENSQAAKWDSDYDDNAVAYSQPAYVNISYSPESENSQEESINFQAPSSPTHYIAAEHGKSRILRTKASHRSGRLFVQPPRFNEPSTHTDKNGEASFQEDLQKNNSEYENGEVSLDSISYATQLLGQEEPELLMSYMQ